MLWDNIGSVIGVFVGVASLLGFSAAFVNGKRKDGYNQILKASNDELRSSIDDKDKRIGELESELVICKKAHDEADKLRQAAVDMAQSRPQFDTLGTQMVKQHKELLAAIGRQTRALADLAETISKSVSKPRG